MNLDEITPVILTHNEERNIFDCLASLSWAPSILIVDSGSTDKTLEIAQQFPNVNWINHPFQTHSQQMNFALESDRINTPWVLAMDADYRVTLELKREIESLVVDPSTTAYEIPFRYAIQGKPLKSSLYPPVTALIKLKTGNYIQDGHAHRWRIHTGTSRSLQKIMLHDDRKPPSRFYQSQWKYMKIESLKLRKTPFRLLSFPDQLRKLVIIAPFAAVFYILIVKKGILDGLAGWIYAFQRFSAESILSYYLLGGRRK